MKHAKLVFFVFVALIVIILAVQNIDAMFETVQFRINPFFFPEMRTPHMAMGLVTLMAFFLGIVVAGVCGILERFHLKRQIKRCEKELEIVTRELNSLRNLPITSEGMNPRPMNGV